jgi:hypothetical protein
MKNNPTNYKYKDTELAPCKVCNKMTNHLDGYCQKHTMKNKLPDIKHKDLHFACLCAGLRRRNAGLCLKCEISLMPVPEMDNDLFKMESDLFDAGFIKAKNDILRLLEQ